MGLVRLGVEVHAVRRLVGARVRRRLDLMDVSVLEIRELKRVHDVRVAEGAGGGRDAKVALLGHAHPRVALLGLDARLVVATVVDVEPDLQRRGDG